MRYDSFSKIVCLVMSNDVHWERTTFHEDLCKKGFLQWTVYSRGLAADSIADELVFGRQRGGA